MSLDADVRWMSINSMATVASGATPSRSRDEYWANGVYPWVRTSEIKFKEIDNTAERVTRAAVKDANLKVFPVGAIVLAMYGEGATRGRSAILNIPASVNQATAAIVCNSQYVDSRYLYYYLENSYEEIRKIGQGSNQTNLNATIVGNIKVAVPSLERQWKIIDVLATFADERRSIEAHITKLKLMRAGLIQSLDRYEQGTLGSIVASGPQNGIYKSAGSYGIVGTPIVRINSFDGGPSVLTSGLLRVDATSAEVAKYRLNNGDLLVNRVNTVDLVGKSTVVAELGEETIFESNIMRCGLDPERSLPSFVEAWMSGYSVKRHFLRRAKSAVSQASLNQDDVLSCPFPIISILTQREFLIGLERIDSQIRVGELELTKLGDVRRGLAGDLLPGKVRTSGIA
jgi:type I restriction enzyme, S subunit